MAVAPHFLGELHQSRDATYLPTAQDHLLDQAGE
jgi:hypothetical protein